VAELIPRLQAMKHVQINCGWATDLDGNEVPVSQIDLYVEDKEGNQDAWRFRFNEEECQSVHGLLGDVIEVLAAAAAEATPVDEETDNG
jgi:hypothetical protein